MAEVWDYPPQGSCTASCGHRVFEDMGEPVAYASWDTFSDGSYGPCTTYACYCPFCALKIKVSGLFIAEPEMEEA